MLGFDSYSWPFPGKGGAAQRGVGDSVGTLSRRVRLLDSPLLCRGDILSSDVAEASASPKREDDLINQDKAYS